MQPANPPQHNNAPHPVSSWTPEDAARARGAKAANVHAALEQLRAGARSHRDRLEQLIAAGHWTGETWTVPL